MMMEDWVECTLGEVCEKAEKVKRKEMSLSQEIKYLDIGGIDNISNKVISHKEYTWETAPSRAQQIVKKGDVLFSTVRTYLKNIAQVNSEDYENEICSSGLTVLRGSKNILLSNYLFYFSLSTGFLNSLNKLQKGTSYPAVRNKDVFAQTLILPPLPIQRAIVTKIEELFSSLDSGIADLKKAQAQLKVYRQAVLKKAFEGELTKEWRAQQTDLPTAEELLVQIKEEREKHYERQLEDWKKAIVVWEENGKEGRKPGKPRTLKELPCLTEEITGDSSFGWIWVQLLMLVDLKGGVTKGRKLGEQKLISLPYLRVANVQDGYLDLSQIKYIQVLPNDLVKYKLIKGDILYTEGGDKDKLGRGTIWNNEIKDCIHQNHIFRARLYSDNNPKFISYFSQTRLAKNYFFKNGKQTTNLASINMTVLSNLPVPFCTIPEQHQIVKEIETRLSVCDKVEKDIADSLEKAKALRQSILKKAFEGKLLSEAEIAECKQAADYEPASVLLEKIRAEKANKKKKR